MVAKRTSKTGNLAARMQFKGRDMANDTCCAREKLYCDKTDNLLLLLHLLLNILCSFKTEIKIILACFPSNSCNYLVDTTSRLSSLLTINDRCRLTPDIQFFHEFAKYRYLARVSKLFSYPWLNSCL